MVKSKVGRNDYRLEVKGKDKTFHANLLKRYVDRREIDDCAEVASAGAILKSAGACVMVEEKDTHKGEGVLEMVMPPNDASETVRDAHIGNELSSTQQSEMTQLLFQYYDVLTDRPGVTNLIQYTLPIPSKDAVRSKAYPLPVSAQAAVENEVETMLKLGVIEPSESAYASPIVLARKKDGTNRFCIDFRKLIALFDPGPNSVRRQSYG